MEVLKINDNTWRIEDNGVRMFLLAGTEKAMLIDSGMTAANAKEIAEGLVSVPVELLNTHCDIDHVCGNMAFETFYMHPAESVVYYNSRPGRTNEFIPVVDGDKLELGGRTLEIIHIPGHTPGSIAVLDTENRVLISGDSVQDGNIYMFGPYREFHALLHSMKKLEGMNDRFDVIWPSHSTFPVGPEMIGAVYEGAKKVMSGEIAGEEKELYGQKIRLCRTEKVGFLCPM